jgi:hypothetical protein
MARKAKAQIICINNLQPHVRMFQLNTTEQVRNLNFFRKANTPNNAPHGVHSVLL